MIYAIGDIHGKFDLLQALYNSIKLDIEECGDKENTIVFLGDYIDRGRQNCQVLDFIKNLESNDNLKHIFIRGNHEDIFIDAMENPRKQAYVSMWVNNGGREFLEEVGMDFDYFNETFAWHQYVNWMKYRLDDYYETEDYIFVHGGLDIRKPKMKDQEPEYLHWARFTDFNWYKSFHKMVIHGHTPRSDPQVDANRVNVDTSWSYTKYKGISNLTAVALPNRRDDVFKPPRFIQAEQHIPDLEHYLKNTTSDFA